MLSRWPADGQIHMTPSNLQPRRFIKLMKASDNANGYFIKANDYFTKAHGRFIKADGRFIKDSFGGSSRPG